VRTISAGIDFLVRRAARSIAARTEAIASRRKAGHICKAAGVTLGAVVGLSENKRIGGAPS